jgi:N-acetylneuraminate synthase
MAERVLIIAEAGVNHNGSLDLARLLIDKAVSVGADVVKFQSFVAEEVVGCFAKKAEYQVRTTPSDESQLEMVRKLQLSVSDHEALIDHCQKRHIRFLSAPFDLPSVRMLTDRFNLPLIKIPSGELTNLPLLFEVGRRQKDVLLSTGMATIGEIEDALAVLAFGFVTADPVPSLSEAYEVYFSSVGQDSLRTHVQLLQCTTEYPTPYVDVNLRAIDTLRQAFGLPVGLSDHTEGIHVAVAAVARGATTIEKHFTLDRNMVGPDHAASLEPDAFREMVTAIRQIEAALGDGRKRTQASEYKNKAVARKSLVAAVPILRGTHFSESNLAIKRPGYGISPMKWREVLGRAASRDFERDEPIEM